MNFPTNGLFQTQSAIKGDQSTSGSRLETGFQLVGEGLGDMSLIVALNGPDVSRLNEALPNLLLRLEAADQLEELDENFDDNHGVIFHRAYPREIPQPVTDCLGADLEMIVGQGKDTVWLGLGSPDKLLEHLRSSIEHVDNETSNRSTTPVIRSQIKGRKLPELLASNPLFPNLDAAVVRHELSQGEDGVSLKIDSTTNGAKLTLDFEEGFVRLIGREWIHQIESADQE